MGPGPTPVLFSRRQSTGDGGDVCCEVARSTDPSRRLISTYRYLTRLGDNHVIATQDEDREKSPEPMLNRRGLGRLLV